MKILAHGVGNQDMSLLIMQINSICGAVSDSGLMCRAYLPRKLAWGRCMSGQLMRLHVKVGYGNFNATIQKTRTKRAVPNARQQLQRALLVGNRCHSSADQNYMDRNHPDLFGLSNYSMFLNKLVWNIG